MLRLSFLVIFSFVCVGCSFTRSGSVSNRQFYQPDVDISKTNSLENKSSQKTTKHFYIPNKYQQKIRKLAKIPIDSTVSSQMIGEASWYGPGFHGKKTANGEIYDQEDMTAAHKILPINTIVRVTNIENDRSIVVRINDRGPYKKNRIIDLSRQAAEKLSMFKTGLAPVTLEIIRYPDNFEPEKGLTPYKQTVVQIAVFSDPEKATFFKKQIANQYTNLDVLIDQPQGKLYHVVAGPFDTRDDAKVVAMLLEQDGINNFVRSYRK